MSLSSVSVTVWTVFVVSTLLPIIEPQQTLPQQTLPRPTMPPWHPFPKWTLLHKHEYPNPEVDKPSRCLPNNPDNFSMWFCDPNSMYSQSQVNDYVAQLNQLSAQCPTCSPLQILIMRQMEIGESPPLEIAERFVDYFRADWPTNCSNRLIVLVSINDAVVYSKLQNFTNVCVDAINDTLRQLTWSNQDQYASNLAKVITQLGLIVTKKHDCNHQEMSSKPKSGEINQALIIGLAILIIVVILVIIGAILLWRRKRRNASEGRRTDTGKDIKTEKRLIEDKEMKPIQCDEDNENENV